MSKPVEPKIKHKTLDILDNSINQGNTVINIGDLSLEELHNQKQKLLKITGDVKDIDHGISFSSRILAKIQYGQNKEKFMCIVIIILLTFTIGILLYFRLRNI